MIALNENMMIKINDWKDIHNEIISETTLKQPLFEYGLLTLPPTPPVLNIPAFDYGLLTLPPTPPVLNIPAFVFGPPVEEDEGYSSE